MKTNVCWTFIHENIILKKLWQEKSKGQNTQFYSSKWVIFHFSRQWWNPYLKLHKSILWVSIFLLIGNTWRILHVSHDQPLRTLFTAPITDSKLVFNSDGQRFPPWVNFRELHNFHVTFIVFDVQIHCIVLQGCWPLLLQHRLQSWSGWQISEIDVPKCV